MSILTKEERADLRKFAAHPYRPDDVIRALDTIDALEAHIKHLEANAKDQEEIAETWHHRAERRRRALESIDSVARDRMFRAGHITADAVIDRILTIVTDAMEGGR